ADTLTATRDTSRTLALSAAVLDTNLRAVERRAVQVTQRADSLDRALGRERIAKATLVARLDTLTVRAKSVEPVTETDAGERAARFVVDSAPYHVRADVYFPRPPESARIDLSVSIDSIPLEARLSCGAANRDGIRSAFAVVVGPAWAPITLRRIEQDP